MAYYDLKKKSSLTTKEGEKETLYPSIVYERTISSEELLRRVEKNCGIKDGVMAGALMEIMDTMAFYLSEGYRVELGELGIFSGKIKSNRLVAQKTDIRAGSIQFTGVNFRPSKKFCKLSSGELERSPGKQFRQSSHLPAEELERRLTDHLEQHGFITRITYTQLTGRLKNTAYADLKAFVEKGLIRRVGRRSQTIYVKA